MSLVRIGAFPGNSTPRTSAPSSGQLLRGLASTLDSARGAQAADPSTSHFTADASRLDAAARHEGVLGGSPTRQGELSDATLLASVREAWAQEGPPRAMTEGELATWTARSAELAQARLPERELVLQLSHELHAVTRREAGGGSPTTATPRAAGASSAGAVAVPPGTDEVGRAIAAIQQFFADFEGYQEGLPAADQAWLAKEYVRLAQLPELEGSSKQDRMYAVKRSFEDHKAGLPSRFAKASEGAFEPQRREAIAALERLFSDYAGYEKGFSSLDKAWLQQEYFRLMTHPEFEGASPQKLMYALKTTFEDQKAGLPSRYEKASTGNVDVAAGRAIGAIERQLADYQGYERGLTPTDRAWMQAEYVRLVGLPQFKDASKQALMSSLSTSFLDQKAGLPSRFEKASEGNLGAQREHAIGAVEVALRDYAQYAHGLSTGEKGWMGTEYTRLAALPQFADASKQQLMYALKTSFEDHQAGLPSRFEKASEGSAAANGDHAIATVERLLADFQGFERGVPLLDKAWMRSEYARLAGLPQFDDASKQQLTYALKTAYEDHKANLPSRFEKASEGSAAANGGHAIATVERLLADFQGFERGLPLQDKAWMRSEYARLAGLPQFENATKQQLMYALKTAYEDHKDRLPSRFEKASEGGVQARVDLAITSIERLLADFAAYRNGLSSADKAWMRTEYAKLAVHPRFLNASAQDLMYALKTAFEDERSGLPSRFE